MAVDVLDHSLNLAGTTDERDLGFGIEILPDGSIVQRETRTADVPAPTHERDQPEH